MSSTLSSSVTGQISQLINTGRFLEAAQFAQRYANDESVNWSAHFWFQFAVARINAGMDGTSQYLLATMCDDCTDTMKGDIYRDLAVLSARLGDFDIAFGHLDQAQDLAPDVNREAAVLMAMARILTMRSYGRGDHEAALAMHGDAHKMWIAAGDAADPQWIMNNRFYWLRMKALLDRPRRAIYREFKASAETRQDRRRDAALFFWTGPLSAFPSLLHEMQVNETLRIRTMIDRKRSDGSVTVIHLHG